MYRSTALSRCSLLYFAMRGFSSRQGVQENVTTSNGGGNNDSDIKSIDFDLGEVSVISAPILTDISIGINS